MMKTKTEFTEKEIEAFRPAEKIALVACRDPEGLPHVTLITSLMARNARELTIGQFCRGRSKWYMQRNPEIAFLIMTRDRDIWRGKARWTGKQTEGPEYEIYNNMPLFRYNTYFGINTVHYLDLVERSERSPLPLLAVTRAALLTKLAKRAAGGNVRRKERVLKPFAEDLFNQMDALKFLAYIHPDGFPRIIPAIQCQAADSGTLAFAPGAFRNELLAVPAGTRVAVFALNLKMQSVLTRGRLRGYRRFRTVRLGVIDIDWVYNSMPPIHEQIYPEQKLTPAVSF